MCIEKGRMMMINYVKPDVFVTQFNANAFCANCPAESYNQPVTVKCIITSSETVYDTGVTGCDYSGTGLVYFGGGYFKDEHGVIDAFTDGTVEESEYSQTATRDYQYYLAAGSYLVWYGHGNYHVGPVSDPSKITNHS